MSAAWDRKPPTKFGMRVEWEIRPVLSDGKLGSGLVFKARDIARTAIPAMFAARPGAVKIELVRTIADTESVVATFTRSAYELELAADAAGLACWQDYWANHWQDMP